ncbi:uncharacterized protein LOC128269767 [Anopheles cruzii]|uniref:uncharacterized protein LOC128269767 n=1 Tax=Anopheles cruzii TaxID=68878 RepID=UPI0022EC298B|nr:uncharacterized protein LOC128269767 [Anopheles cruzii]
MFSKVIFIALLAIAATSAKPLVPLGYSTFASPYVAAAPALSLASPYVASYSAPVYTTGPVSAAYTAGHPYVAGYPWSTSIVL